MAEMTGQLHQNSAFIETADNLEKLRKFKLGTMICFQVNMIE